MSILEWFLSGMSVLFLGYIVFRLFTKAIFKSYFEAKSEFNQQKKEDKKDEV